MDTPNQPSPAPVALILGITGSIGRAVAAALALRGYRIRAMVRRRPEGAWPHPVEWRVGDALSAADVAAAAEGAAVVMHGVNPPGYAYWREHGLPMLANTIAAAGTAGAAILFPGNVYVFGPRSGPVVDEASPFEATSEKGRVRVEMEGMLSAAAAAGVQSIVLRAGDFFGPEVVHSWFSEGIAAGGRRAKRLIDPTIGAAGHSWAYVPDLAEAFARLTDRRAELPRYAVFHFRGHWLEDGRAMAQEARRALGGSGLRIWRFPWRLLPLLGLVSPFMRELREMAWLWSTSLRLDNAKLERTIGPEPHTPLPAAVAAALGIGQPATPRPAPALVAL